MARLRSCRVSLSHKERKIIRHLLKKSASSNARTRYAILLAADENKQEHIPANSEIASASGTSIPTVIDTLKKYCEEGIVAAVQPARNPNSDTARLKATGDVEAKIIARACTTPSVGHARWTATLLTEQCEVILEENLSVIQQNIWSRFRQIIRMRFQLQTV